MNRDAEIVNRIKKELEEKMQLSAMDINIDCREGNVIISGVADVLAEKIFAEEIAKKIDGVLSVENDITISMDSSNITDSHIKYEIENKLYKSEKQEGLSNVEVDVKGGTAVLMGHVEDDMYKKKATELASSARGVTKIVDNIKTEEQ
ncbi:BON domain-containing protein [Lutispora thermophila]|uniref:Osmotically-inducible protein OsmY, contains BON domain n=1 Tax=Lutispora thermophila DSM 19022 TaxID=1122184 RepID=A0A1M6FF28_9FIRM|nr:BON domain-containing protein [Lutispora thermophila]SHI96246.1 Osmotically-inducible protein OsmY, contains BON domain [Lutispora thermophila DSM 19022]